MPPGVKELVETGQQTGDPSVVALAVIVGMLALSFGLVLRHLLKQQQSDREWQRNVMADVIDDNTVERGVLGIAMRHARCITDSDAIAMRNTEELDEHRLSQLSPSARRAYERRQARAVARQEADEEPQAEGKSDD